MCKSGFTLSNGLCYPLITNCQVQQGPTCLRCNDGRRLVNNICVDNCVTGVTGSTCSSCQSGSFLLNFICHTTVANCASQVESNCSQCNNGYTLNNNLCVDNCLTGTTGTDCSQCKIGFVLDQFKCYTAVANCKNQTMNSCTQCQPYYVLSGA